MGPLVQSLEGYVVPMLATLAHPAQVAQERMSRQPRQEVAKDRENWLEEERRELREKERRLEEREQRLQEREQLCEKGKRLEQDKKRLEEEKQRLQKEKKKLLAMDHHKPMGCRLANLQHLWASFHRGMGILSQEWGILKLAYRRLLRPTGSYGGAGKD